MQHVVDLLDGPAQAPGHAYVPATSDYGNNAEIGDELAHMNDAVADANVTLLKAALDAARAGDRFTNTPSDGQKIKSAPTQVA
jgi:hypothetical protein